jgi:cytidylate kinase
MKSPPPLVIAISRQLGSGGSYIGRLVAGRLGCRYADRGILQQAAVSLGVRKEEIRDPEERQSRLWEEILKIFASGSLDSNYVAPPVPVINDREVFEAEAAILKKMAEEESFVVVGQGAAHILAGHPKLLRVFLHASIEFRIARLMQASGIASPEEAREHIDTSDENRRRFHRTVAGTDWTDARNYDLCINSGAVDLLDVRETILSVAERIRRAP